MSNPRRGTLAIPLTIGMTAVVFLGMLYFYTSSTRSIRAVAALPEVAKSLTTPDKYTGNHPDIVAILEDRQGTAPHLAAKYSDETQEENVRILCFAMLAEMQEASAVPMVVDFLRSRDSRKVAWAIWASSSKRLGEQVPGPILEALKADPDPRLANDALECLEETENVASIEVYEWILAQKFKQDLRLKTIQSLAAFDNPNTVRALEKLFDDADPVIVSRAAELMDKFPNSKPAVLEVLKRALGSESSQLRQAAVRIMDSLKDLPGLETALGNADVPVAVEAAVALSARKLKEELGSIQPGPLKGRMESLVGKVTDPAEIDRLGRAMVPFVTATDRERYASLYEKANQTERLVYIRLLGATAGLAKLRTDETARADFDAIRDRFVDALSTATEAQRPIYEEALHHITGHQIEAQYEPWRLFREAKQEIAAAKELRARLMEQASTLNKAQREEILGHYDKALENFQKLAQSQWSPDTYESEIEDINTRKYDVNKQASTND